MWNMLKHIFKGARKNPLAKIFEMRNGTSLGITFQCLSIKRIAVVAMAAAPLCGKHRINPRATKVRELF
jgi:hypothetical protein